MPAVKVHAERVVVQEPSVADTTELADDTATVQTEVFDDTLLTTALNVDGMLMVRNCGFSVAAYWVLTDDAEGKRRTNS